MKRSQVAVQRTEETHGEALAVIAHARRAISRGRAPSMPYKEQLNPRLALLAALGDVGCTMADLHLVGLKPAPVPIQTHKAWVRQVRRWLHNFKLALRAARIPCSLPVRVTNRTVMELLPRLIELAKLSGATMPLGQASSSRRVQWYDVDDTKVFTLNELELWPLHHYFGFARTT